MRKVTAVSRLRYSFDNLVSRGSATLIGMLAVASGAAILVIALVGWLAGVTPAEEEVPAGLDGFLHIAWMGLMRTFDAGTMGGDKGSPLFLAVMMAFTVAGIFVFSMFIGLLTAGLESKLEELRKGRSVVLEKNHELILGWSSKIFT